MLQELIVGVIVLAAAWVVARKYLPATVRRRTAAVLARLLRRAGSRPLTRSLTGRVTDRLATWLESDLPAASSCADGCGTCGNCGSSSSSSSNGSSVNSGSANSSVSNQAPAATILRASQDAQGALQFSITPDALRRTITSTGSRPVPGTPVHTPPATTART